MFTFRIYYKSIGLEVNTVSVTDREERVRGVNKGTFIKSSRGKIRN